MQIWRSLTMLAVLAAGAAAQSKLPQQANRTFLDPASYAPDPMERASTSELRDLVLRYSADRQLIARFYTIPGSQTRLARMRAFQDGYIEALRKAPFDQLSQQGKVDYVLLRHFIEFERRALDREAQALRQMAPLVPFSEEIALLQEARQRLEFIESAPAASALQAIVERVSAARAGVESGSITAAPPLAARAAEHVDGLNEALAAWFNFYNLYDPAFTASVPPVYTKLNTALTQYAALLREKLGGLPPGAAPGRRPGPAGRGRRGEGGNAPADAGAGMPLALGQPIIGTPVGREALLEELQREMISYTPEQLIELGKREYAWTENEMKKAARDLGFGDDWHAALEKVKAAYVPRGRQPELVRNLQVQAEKFLREHDLVTIPPLAHDAWRMNMMSPAQMRTAPFFLGGESILVSYPVAGMSEDLATMIMKGNGPHLSHATVFHELIPGHQMQGFMAQRYNSHRSLFSTPFYGEGWALYWEMQLWDMGFHATPEDRIGALFWRMHRAARIVFTLNYQMGLWTPQQCVDFLVSNGHERYTAEGEVRGHVQGGRPLYQISYMVGALQLRSLYKELVTGKKAMTTKQFNDRFLRTGPMPMAMVRALLANQPLTRDYLPQWDFYPGLPKAK